MRVYAGSSKQARELMLRIERGHLLASVMVWWVLCDGTTSMHFCENWQKNQWDILDLVMKPLNQSMFQNQL